MLAYIFFSIDFTLIISKYYKFSNKIIYKKAHTFGIIISNVWALKFLLTILKIS